MSDVAEDDAGLSLDRFIDATIAEDGRGADWSAMTASIARLARRPSSPSLASGSVSSSTFETRVTLMGAGGTPLQRLGGTSLASAAEKLFSTRDSGRDPVISSIGLHAANVLASLDIKSLIERVLNRPIGDLPAPIIVFHGEDNTRRSVLQLLPELSDGEGIVIPSALLEPLFRASWSDLGSPVRERARRDLTGDPLHTLEAMLVARPRLIVAPRPEMMDLCVSHPAGDVRCGNKTSSTGALARDTSDRPGVTVCFHGAGPPGTALTINGNPHSVSQASEALDIAFVPLADTDLTAAQTRVAQRGLLVRRAPGAAEDHSFWAGGASGGAKNARIIGTDFGLPDPTPQRQLCLYTEPRANYGDSGSALVNEDDQLVGFCFQRTAITRSLQYATWVWAYSAFQELGLKPF